jgi:dTDP-4-amino-4,6-dideoxygalactose transaminase
MIKLLHVNDYTLNTADFIPLLNSPVVEEFEQNIANYVGAKYAVSLNSATSAIFLLMLNKGIEVTIPSIIPPVVANAIITSGNKVKFNDDVDWVGGSYILHNFGDYKIVDSAQKLERNQYINECNDDDLMVFSHYPTKPVGSSDGGMIVSNNKEKIDQIRILSKNGNTIEKNSWERSIVVPGYKLYMNSMQAYIANENFKKLEDKRNSFEKARVSYNNAFNLNNTSYHLYRINVNNRDEFINHMKECEIQVGMHYKALHLVDCYNPDKTLLLPKSELESETTVSLPYHELLTQEEIDYVIEKVKPFIN